MFDRFVTRRRPSWTGRALLIGSLVLHGGVALTLVIASWFHVAELTPPALSVVFMAAPQPPPQGSPTRPKPHPNPKPSTRPQPPTHAITPPTAPEPSQPDADDPHSPGDLGKPGPPGDPHSTMPPCTGPNCPGITARPPKPRNVPPHALDAQRIGGAMPHLPASVIGARRGLGEATFTARLCVDQSGTVSSVTVLSGIPGADNDIVSTVRNWRYKPQPIPVCFVTQFVYDVQ